MTIMLIPFQATVQTVVRHLSSSVLIKFNFGRCRDTVTLRTHLIYKYINIASDIQDSETDYTHNGKIRAIIGIYLLRKYVFSEMA